MATDELPRTSQDRSELMLALLAGVAMVAFAWAGFQSSQWVRERFLRSDDAAALSEEALELAAEADRAEERDTLLYVEWRLAIEEGDQEVADRVFDLFRDDFQGYLEAADRDARGVPLTDPRDDPAYDVVADRAAAAELDREAVAATSASRDASGNGARFGVLGLVFAAVLAAVGIASRLELTRTRNGLAWVSGTLLAVGVVVMVGLPTILEWP